MSRLWRVLGGGALAFFFGLAVLTLFQEDTGGFLFAISFLLVISLLWACLRFYQQRRPGALKPLILPALALSLAIGFSLWRDRPCPGICAIEVETMVIPAEKREYIDPETGARIVQLTSHPADDSFDYYEPSHWSPDDKKLKFDTSRFREQSGDPVLHMLGTLNVETGEITFYRTKYSVHWSEWSRDGRYIYGVALYKDRKLEPYFIAIDTEKGMGKVLRLHYKVSELPHGFDERVGAVKDPEKAANRWLVKGEYRIPYEALFFHLNPSGTLGGFEMYGAFGVVDLERWQTWVVDIGNNRGAFFDDRTAMLSPLPVNAPYAEATAFSPRLVDVFTKERQPHPPGPSLCNHGNVLYENDKLTRIVCPGRIPDTLQGNDTLYLYDVRDGSIDILSQMPEPECCGAPATISSDGKRVAGLSFNGVTVYDVATKRKAVPLSGKFLDKYIAAGGAHGAAFGGQPMISHDGQKVAFVTSMYESPERLREMAAIEISCEQLKELQKWAGEKPRTAQERQRAAGVLGRPENIELDRKCQQREKYTPDIFVVHLQQGLFQ